MKNFRNDLKRSILDSERLSNFVFFIINLKYSLKNCKKIRGKGNKMNISPNSLYRNVKFKISGNNNQIIIEKRCLMRNVMFEVEGSNNKIIIGEKINIMEKAVFLITGDNCTITIGAKSLFRDASFFAGESNTKIEIGNNCFCGIVSFSTSDFHSIIDLTSGKRINAPASIKVGSDNWITNHILIRKGAEIKNFTVISPYSIVNKKFEKSNVILAGQPARIVKEEITWSRELLPY